MQDHQLCGVADSMGWAAKRVLLMAGLVQLSVGASPSEIVNTFQTLPSTNATVRCVHAPLSHEVRDDLIVCGCGDLWRMLSRTVMILATVWNQTHTHTHTDPLHAR